MKRIALYLLLLGLAAALVVGIVRWAAARPLTGKLSFDANALPPASFQVENFLIDWEPARGALTISSVTTPGKVLWANLPGRAFVAAASGSETVTESRAMFTVKDHRAGTCAAQSITAFEPGLDTLTVRGVLRCRGQAVAGGQAEYTLAFSSPRPNALRFDLSTSSGALNRLFLTYASQRDEGFYGFGEQFSVLNMKGRLLPVFISEQGVGRGAQPITIGADLTAGGAGGKWWTSYAGVPWYLTSKLRALFLENSEFARFDLRRADMAQVEVFSTRMAGQILNGDTPAALIENYTLYSGRMRVLPEWINTGAVVGMQGGTQRVREVLAQLKAHDTPIAAFWLQDWVGQRATSFGKQLWWNWELDEERYPGWQSLVEDLKRDNIRVMVYASPFLADVSAKPNARRNLYREAAEQGFLVRDASGQPYQIQNTDFSAGLLDLTNPAAVTWFKTVLKENLLGAGATGWMADFGEGLPYDARLASGEPAAAYHNRYPEDWAALNRAVLDENGLSDEGVFFTRSGYTRSPGSSTLFWTGDQLVSWDAYDGIKTAVMAMQSGGLSGFALNHSDIGGYTTISNPLKNYYRSKELLLRWMELAAFTPVYRTHEGNRPDNNAQFYSDEESLAHFARFARIYTALTGYRRVLYEDAVEYGLPVVRHPLIQYPEDPQAWQLTYQQFMLGSELMIAPVLDEGQEEVSVYLPAGRWVHLWSGQPYGDTNRGVTVTVPAPLGQPGVFYLAGSKTGEDLRKLVSQP